MILRLTGVVVLLGLVLVGLWSSGAGNSAQAQEQPAFPTLTVGQLLGVRLSAEQPPPQAPISGLALGLGADLALLAGDVTVGRLAGDLTKSATIERQSGGGMTAGTYCYLLTAFVDDKEVLQGAGPSQISVESGQQVVFRWQVDERMRQVAQFGAKAGYRIYRFCPLPANTQCTAVQLGQYGRLGELTLTIPVPPSLSFTDDGRKGFIGGAPQLKAGGDLTVAGTATVGTNLTVGQLAMVGSLQVGPGPAPGAGNAQIAGQLNLGPGAVIPGVPPAPPAAAALLRWQAPGPGFKQWDLVAAQALPPLPAPTQPGATSVFALLERFPQPGGAALSRLEVAVPPGNWTINLGTPLLPGNPPAVPPIPAAPGSFTIADLAAPATPRLQINNAGNVGIGVPAPPGPPAALGPGNVAIAGQLQVGALPAAPPVAVGPGAMYFDTTQNALCVRNAANTAWDCLSATTIINVLVTNTTFLQNIIALLIENNTFIQNIIVNLGGNVEFRQTIINMLVANVEFRQTIINLLVQNVEFRQALIAALTVNVEFRQTIINLLVQSVEFRQTIVNILVADERFKSAVIEAVLKDEKFLKAVADALRPVLDNRYVLKPRDESDLTIGSLLSLGQLAGDWLVVGEPKDNTNFWALINPDNGPDLALGTVEPPNLSALKLSVMEFERATGKVRIPKDLEVGGTLTIEGSLSLEDLEVKGDLRVGGDTELEDLLGRDAEFDNVTVNRDLRVKGVKFFVQQHPTDPTKEIAYAALEGPEAGTYVRGAAQLVDGAAVIELPGHFALVTSEAGLTVQLTPAGEWLQLYVVELSPSKLVVREAQGKSGKFFYLVQGVRKGYEGLQAIQTKQEGGKIR